MNHATLKLAAIGSGVEISCITEQGNIQRFNSKGYEVRWRPHQDDGDALRALVKVRGSVALDHRQRTAVASCRWYGQQFNGQGSWPEDGNPWNATRTAIVQMLALVGESKLGAEHGKT